MTMSTSRYQLDAQAARAAGAVQRGAELRLPCPAHDSSPETLALRQGRGGPIWHCHAGCHPADVRDALLAARILKHPDPHDPRTTVRQHNTRLPHSALPPPALARGTTLGPAPATHARKSHSRQRPARPARHCPAPLASAAPTGPFGAPRYASQPSTASSRLPKASRPRWPTAPLRASLRGPYCPAPACSTLHFPTACKALPSQPTSTAPGSSRPSASSAAPATPASRFASTCHPAIALIGRMFSPPPRARTQVRSSAACAGWPCEPARLPRCLPGRPRPMRGSKLGTPAGPSRLRGPEPL